MMKKIMSIEERESVYERISLAMLRNYDEITDHEEPYVSLDLSSSNLDLPSCYTRTDVAEFVDELWGDLDEIKHGYGVYIAFAKDEDDYCERTDEIDIETLDDDYLLKILEIAENHKGLHYGSENLEK